MVRALLLLILLATASLGFSQGYKPKAGETVMKLTVQSRGEIYILLHTKQAPKATSRVIGLVNRRFYNDQKFFRVVKKPRPFLIQFGDPGSKTKPMSDKSLGSGGSGTKVAYEDSGFQNVVGAVGLATSENDKNSGDSQFYILLSDSRFLNGTATVFGKVVHGMDVVRKVKLGDKVTSVSIIRG